MPWLNGHGMPLLRQYALTAVQRLGAGKLMAKGGRGG